MQEFKFDIFISYAREDSTWVRHNLYEPLMRCVIRDENGTKRPVIFLDNSDMGIATGENFVSALSAAIRATRKFLPVYSESYFQKEMTLWELSKAFQLDPMGKKRLINPILFSSNPDTESKVPFEVNHINYINVLNDPDWFKKLQGNLGLLTIKDVLELGFRTRLEDAEVNITLPPVQVELVGGSEYEETIELGAEDAALTGTTRQKTIKGVATFTDLSFTSAATQVRLTAKAEGYRPVFSDPFRVSAPRSTGSNDNLPPGQVPESSVVTGKPDSCDTLIAKIEAEGILDARLFDSGKAIALFFEHGVSVHSLSGEQLRTSRAISSPLKCLYHSGSLIAAVDWRGNLVLLRHDGGIREYSPDRDADIFSIPGDMTICGDRCYVGFWNGTVQCISIDKAPFRVLDHSGGIHQIEAIRDSLYLCDLNGTFHIFQDNNYIYSRKIETATPSMHLFENHGILFIGQTRASQLLFGHADLYSEEVDLGEIVATLRQGNQLFLLDSEGKGLCMDRELIQRARFHTVAGAKPICASEDGRYCVFSYPGGTAALLDRNKIVCSRPSGLMCFDPGLSCLALGNTNVIELHHPSRLAELY